MAKLQRIAVFFGRLTEAPAVATAADAFALITTIFVAVEGRDDLDLYRQAAHDTIVRANGAILIRIRRTGVIVFEKAGSDGEKGRAMTNEREKNAAWLADRLRADLPASKVTVHKPSPKGRGTGWVIDADYRDHSVVVMWTKADGFGLATPKDDEPYGSTPSEIHDDGDEALARVLHLLRTGEQARTHREMRLQELRTHRSFSQEVLAKAMHVSQASISQTERREDVMLSTLQNYIEGLGGKLRVVAEFPGEKIELELGAQSRLSK